MATKSSQTKIQEGQLVDGLIGGAIFAWLCNWLVDRFQSAA
jgi:hypothetical protein